MIYKRYIDEINSSYVINTSKKVFSIIDSNKNKTFEYRLNEFNITNDFKSIVEDLKRAKTMTTRTNERCIDKYIELFKKSMMI